MSQSVGCISVLQGWLSCDNMESNMERDGSRGDRQGKCVCRY